MDKLLKIAVVLTAIDRMSQEVENATRKSTEAFKKMQNDFIKGAGLITAGLAIAKPLTESVSAYADLEDAATNMKVAMMGANGEVGKSFQQVTDLATELGNKLPGTSADFNNMFTALLRQGIDAEMILNGTGQAAAYLGVQLKMGMTDAAEFAAKMKFATQTADADMMKLMDTMQKGFFKGMNTEDMVQGFAKMTPVMDMIKKNGIQAVDEFMPMLMLASRAKMAGEQAGNAYRKMFQSFFVKGDVAREFGLDFTDKKGEFGGMDNMFKQFEKLKQFNTEERTSIIKKIFGDDAETMQVVNLMINRGLEGIKDMNKELKGQADLQTRVNEQLGTLRNIWDAISGTFTNAMASWGQSIQPELQKIGELLRDVILPAIQSFVANHPKLMKFIGLFMAISSGALLVAGAIYVINGALLFLSANPIILIVAAVIAAIAAVYIFRKEIIEFITSIWEWVKVKFSAMVEFIKGIPTAMYEAGKNIVQSIIDGISAKAEELYGKVKELAQKVRDFFPFSPAKTGPLRDIHKIKFAETLAMSIKPAPVLKAVSNVARAMSGEGATPFAPMNRGGSNITISPVINLNGSATQKDATLITDSLREMVRKIMKDEESRFNRVKYA